MRDDLHRTAAVTAVWKTVLRYAPNKAERLTHLPRTLEDAVRSDLRTNLSPELVRALRGVVSHGVGDLFGSEGVGAAILSYASSVQTSTDRELFEIVRAASAFKRNDPNAFAACVEELIGRVVDRSFEHLVAKVRMEHIASARELRGVLNVARKSCNFAKLMDSEGNIAPRERRRNKAIDLSEVIAT
jgi:tellurite resistance protein